MTEGHTSLTQTVSLFLKDIVAMFHSSFKKGVTEANFISHYRFFLIVPSNDQPSLFVDGWCNFKRLHKSNRQVNNWTILLSKLEGREDQEKLSTVTNMMYKEPIYS